MKFLIQHIRNMGAPSEVFGVNAALVAVATRMAGLQAVWLWPIFLGAYSHMSQSSLPLVDQNPVPADISECPKYTFVGMGEECVIQKLRGNAVKGTSAKRVAIFLHAPVVRMAHSVSVFRGSAVRYVAQFFFHELVSNRIYNKWQ